MEDSQDARQDPGADESSPQQPAKSQDNKAEDAPDDSISSSNTESELGEKIKNIDVQPVQPPSTTLSKPSLPAPAKSLPIGRVKQLRDTALGQPASLGSSGSATGNPRNKTALAPGHSLMDWIRLGSSGVDLTGVGGRLLTVTPAELARHNKENDAWIAIRGIVFNVSRYTSFHPGGIPELMKGAGKDATKLFDDVHAWVNYQSILQKCVVGRLARPVNAELYFASDKDKLQKEPKSSEGRSEPTTAVKLDWRQTSNGVSLFFAAAKKDARLDDCQIRRLADSEFELRIGLEAAVALYRLKLAEHVDWPPECRRSAEAQEVEMVFKKKNRGIWKTYGTHSASQEKNEPAKRTYNEYEVLENTPLCKVVHLLVLRAQNYIQLVPPGRHVEVKMNVMGTEVSRPYTPVPSYLHPEDRPASATGDDTLCLMVKRYDDGALSPALTNLRPGDKLQLSNGLGKFRVEEYDECTAMHLLAAGSGLTVMLGIMKRALSRRNPPSINLINFNKDEDNVFYARELDRIAGERTLKVTQILSAAGSSWEGRRGGVTEELLRDLMGEPSARACVFTCGPTGFMTAARESLRNLGWEPSRMHEFDG